MKFKRSEGNTGVYCRGLIGVFEDRCTINRHGARLTLRSCGKIPRDDTNDSPTTATA
jgi:hypothetical protein